MTLELIETVYMCGDYLPALINDDWTGLADDEARRLHAYQSMLPPCAVLNVIDGGDNWTRCEVCSLLADCTTVEIWAPAS